MLHEDDKALVPLLRVAHSAGGLIAAAMAVTCTSYCARLSFSIPELEGSVRRVAFGEFVGIDRFAQATPFT